MPQYNNNSTQQGTPVCRSSTQETSQAPVTTCIAAACCVLLIRKQACNIVRHRFKHLKTSLAKLADGRRYPADRHLWTSLLTIAPTSTCTLLLQISAEGQCSIHHKALHTVAKSTASSCCGRCKFADSETKLQQWRRKKQMPSNDRMAHRLALMADVKGSQQGKGSHTHKGRGAREARPCTACAHASGAGLCLSAHALKGNHQ